jgi:hypothetical protein
VALGVNVTLIVQLAPADSEAPQVVVSEYSPDAPIDEIVKAVLVPFFSVTVFALLGIDRASFPKDKLAGETVTLWAAESEVNSSTMEITMKFRDPDKRARSAPCNSVRKGKSKPEKRTLRAGVARPI